MLGPCQPQAFGLLGREAVRSSQQECGAKMVTAPSVSKREQLFQLPLKSPRAEKCMCLRQMPARLQPWLSWGGGILNSLTRAAGTWSLCLQHARHCSPMASSLNSFSRPALRILSPGQGSFGEGEVEVGSLQDFAEFQPLKAGLRWQARLRPLKSCSWQTSPHPLQPH